MLFRRHEDDDRGSAARSQAVLEEEGTAILGSLVRTGTTFRVVLDVATLSTECFGWQVASSTSRDLSEA